jgi:hypothetical protein
VINMIFHLMSSWAIFQVKETNCDALILGAKLFLRLSSEAFQASKGWRPVVRRITDDIEDPGIKWEIEAKESWCFCSLAGAIPPLRCGLVSARWAVAL